MKTLIALEGIEFIAFHGFYDEERKKGNTFSVDVQVEVKSFDAIDDNINDTVNYEKVYEIVEDEMSKTKKLIETVAYAIIQRLREINNVTSVRIKLTKHNPPIKGKVQKASVEMRI